MESEGSIPHSQGFSSNDLPWAERTQFLELISISLRSILILSSHLRLGLPKGIFPEGLPVKILKALLLSSILATCPVHLNLLDLITLNGTNYEVPRIDPNNNLKLPLGWVTVVLFSEKSLRCLPLRYFFLININTPTGGLLMFFFFLSFFPTI